VAGQAAFAQEVDLRSDGAGRAHPWRAALVVLNQKDQRSYRLLADEVERAAMSPSKWRPALPRRIWR
jgi:hypothetical protein